MTLSAAFTLAFQLITLLGFTVTSFRLYSSGLFRRYRFFFAYLIFSAVQTGTAAAMNVKSREYWYFWIYSEPVLWVFYVLVVLELYSLVLDKYKGLYSMGRLALYASVALSVLLSGLTMLYRAAGVPARQGSHVLVNYFAIERGVVCSLLIFLFLILLILSRYPVQLSRNVVIHCIVYSAFFLSNTLGLLLRSVLGISVSRWLSNVQVGITALCVVLWAVLLSRKGESHLITLASLAPEQEERILSKLDALNTTFLRAARK